MEAWQRYKKHMYALAAFVLPALIMLLICILAGFYPFGRLSILVADMRYQFVDYIGYMKHIFFGNDDFLYSFSKTFGGDMSGFAAYYLFNPFYLILLLFPNSELPVGILVMVIIMAGFCGLTFHCLIREVYGNRYATLIFSTAYALMGYYVAYINCIHYFFSTMMFPLVILGLYRVYRSGKPKLFYIFSVAVCVCSNYYIGYMILLFTAMFFFGLVVKETNSFRELKTKLGLVWTVLYSTILGVLISAFSLFAVVFSLRNQKSSGIVFTLARNFRLSEFFSGLYTNAFHGNVSDGLPIIYSGIIPVVFLFFYLFNKTIPRKERILTAMLFVIINLSFWLDSLNVVWHGFAHPIGFPYRNSFIFSFLVLFFGYKGFICFKEGFKAVYANILIVVFVIYSACLYLMHSEYVTLQQIAVSGMVLVIALIFIYMLRSGRKYVIPAIVGLMVLHIGDLTFNGYYSVCAYFQNDEKSRNADSFEAYSDYILQTEQVVNTIESVDDSMYRMDKLYRRTHNDAMMFGYNGLSHFSSCENDFVKRFMGKIGYRDNGNWAYYAHGSTAFADSLMGVKYLLSQYDETAKPYNFFTTVEDKFIYINPYALPFGFGMDEDIENINMEESDPFILQNKIASCFTDTHYEIYKPVTVSGITTSNVAVDGQKFTRTNPDEEAYIEYSLSINSPNFIYMYFDAPTLQKTQILVNGAEKPAYFTEYGWGITECGHFEKGMTIPVRIVLNQDTIEIEKGYFYYENPNVLKMWHKEAAKTTCDMEKITSSHLIANVNLSSACDELVFSIPYEKDWIVYVDGKKTDTKKVMDALLAIDISSGEHMIEMRYIPRGLLIGGAISIAALITTFCVYFASGRRKSTR